MKLIGERPVFPPQAVRSQEDKLVNSRFSMKITNLIQGAGSLANAGEGIVFLMFYNKTKYSRKSPKIDLGIHVLSQYMAENLEQV